MTTTLRQLTALLFGTAILFTGNGLINTLLPVRAEIEAFSDARDRPARHCLLRGLHPRCLVVPLLVRRVGHIRTFAALPA